MKKLFLTMAIAMSGYCTYAQTNTFPSSGNVGIGTTSPSYPFQVNASSGSGLSNVASFVNPTNGGRTIITASGSAGIVPTWTDGSQIVELEPTGSGNSIISTYTGSLLFQTGYRTNRMIINSSGNVGIGTTSPLRKLDVLSSSGVTPFAAVGPNGYILIDNTGAGYNYYGASVLHEFQIGSTAVMDITSNGNVLIGKTLQTNTAYKLDINGSARANEVVVNTTGADFVFDPKYNLPKLSDVKTYIEQNHHLPEIPSAVTMQKDGMSVGGINIKLLQKVEELTLYLIDKDKQLKEQQRRISELESQQVKSQQQETRITALEAALEKLTANSN